MKISLKDYSPYLILVFVVIFLLSYGTYYSLYYSSSEITLSPQELVAQELSVSAFSPQSVWDQTFLAYHKGLKEKIVRFERGEVCKNLKEIDNKNLTHRQITEELHKRGFKCVVRPLTVSPTAPSSDYLKIDNTITQNPQDKDVAHQEICQDPYQPECVIRIKRDGFPRHTRPMPHSSKAVLMDSTGDPGSYENEAFKVGVHGQPLPKGPALKFGLKKCPYPKNEDACTAWVDKVMEEAHPPLKEPQRTPQVQ